MQEGSLEKLEDQMPPTKPPCFSHTEEPGRAEHQLWCTPRSAASDFSSDHLKANAAILISVYLYQKRSVNRNQRLRIATQKGKNSRGAKPSVSAFGNGLSGGRRGTFPRPSACPRARGRRLQGHQLVSGCSTQWTLLNLRQKSRESCICWLEKRSR